jgi:ribosome-binding ATPase YchF (GTP1/OBG family)
VIFNDNEEAEACDQRITLLKRELRLPDTYEFHYKKDSDIRKQAFLESIAPYDFFYYGIVVDKKLLYSINLQIRETFYKYICSLVFENAKEKIHNANVFVDGTYEKAFEQSFQKYLKTKMNINGSYKIKKVKMLDSKKHHLLQVADYIASGLQCEHSSKRKSFMHLVKHREMYVQVRPKGKPAPIPKEDQPHKAGRS